LEARPACGARCRRDRSAKYARARRCVFRACDHLGPVYARASELQIWGATPVAGCDRDLPAARAGGAENALCAGNRAIRLLACGNLAREQLEIRRLEALEFAVVGPPAERAARGFARDAAIGRFHVALEPAVDFRAGGGGGGGAGRQSTSRHAAMRCTSRPPARMKRPPASTAPPTVRDSAETGAGKPSAIVDHTSSCSRATRAALTPPTVRKSPAAT